MSPPGRILASLIKGTIAAPLMLMWKACSSPTMDMLRAVGLQSPPAFPPYDVDMSSRVVIVTGANTGIGSRTAFHLAKMGAKVIMACRSVERGECARVKIEQEIRESSSAKVGTSAAGLGTTSTRHGTLEVMQLDLSDLKSVRAFARAFEKKHDQLDVLVNNAGIGSGRGRQPLTADGLDLIFGTNFIGHFALTMELMPLIESTPRSRVICLSSVTHHTGCTEWESAAAGHVENRFESTYADSKLAMVLFAKELRRRFAASGSSATAFSVNPGAVRSDIWRFIPKRVAPISDFVMRMLFIDVDEGCCTSVCTSVLPLKSLSDSDYYQPYWMPFGCPLPCEIVGPFVGCAPGHPTIPKNEPAASAEMWSVCERIVATATAARGDSPGVALG